MERDFTIQAEGQVWVRTVVRAKSKTEALRLARHVPDRDWKQSAFNAMGLQCHEVIED